MIIMMRYLFLFIFTISLNAQSSSTNETVGTPEVRPNELNSSSKSSSIDDDELDKEFYTYYYMNLPKHLQKEDKDKKKLHTNLLKAFKKEISKRDRTATKEVLKDVSISTIKIKRVFEDSKWMKQIKVEMRFIRFTEYMYIVKYKKYLTLILYQLDPEMHLQSPSQIEFIMAREAEIIQDPNY